MSREKVEIQCKDVVEGVAGAILEQIPVVNFFVSAVGKVKEGTLQRRFESWQKMIGERLATLEDIVFDTLGDNENFTTVFVKATELAAKSNKIKMECLANAVKYVATNKVEEEYIIVFLNCIEKYTTKHLEALCSFQEVKGFTPIPMDRAINGVEEQPFFRRKYPKIDANLAKFIIDELRRDGLYRDDIPLDNRATTLMPRTTNLGKQFIDFFGLNDVEL